MARLIQESISFQKTTFFDELTIAFEEIKKLKFEDVSDSEIEE